MSDERLPNEPFPVAQISPAKQAWYQQLSRMWFATIACLVLAIGLTWYSMDAAGTMVAIRFPEGHGLKPGDVLRHRGIDVGEVRRIDLSANLDSVIVHAELLPSAEAMACEGTKFWIVRPQLDLTGISGLETAVGAKYIAVVPGNSDLKKVQFDGLDSRPPDGAQRTGLELVLRGAERFGVHPGSPLTWRGVEVGAVLSSGLSPDARHVDTRVQVFEAYRRLVSRDSKFWVTSGFQLDLGMSGLELSADSLASIARGGIAFITPGGDVDSAGDSVQPGEVFTLHDKPEEAWTESASAIHLLKQPTPRVGRVQAEWARKVLGFTRRHQTAASAIVIAGNASATLFFPADLTEIPEDAIEDSFQWSYRSSKGQTALPPLAETTATSEGDLQQQIFRLPMDLQQVPASDRVPENRVRVPVSPEDGFAVRNSGQGEDDSLVVLEMIGRDQWRQRDDGTWLIANGNLNREIWHGAVVIASQDEKVIGMLVVVDDLPAIVPLPLPTPGESK